MIKDVTDKYYEMLNSFRADNFLKISQVNNEDFTKDDEPFFEVEKRLIKNKDSRYMKDIELLEELEFNIRHNKVRIIEIDDSNE